MRLPFTTLTLVFVASGIAFAADPPVDANLLKLEVDALQSLRSLELTPAQLKSLAGLAKGAADGRQRENAKTNAQYAAALRKLHEGLVSGDDEKIDAAQAELDNASESEDNEIDDEVEPSANASGNAAKAVKLLTVRQIVSFAGAIDLPDPADRLNDGFESIREDEDKAEAAKRITDEVVELFGPKKASEARPKIAALLKKVAEMSDADFEEKRSELRTQATEAVGEYDAFAVMHRGMDKAMAKLLSNPRLPAAIAVASKWKQADAE